MSQERDNGHETRAVPAAFRARRSAHDPRARRRSLRQTAAVSTVQRRAGVKWSLHRLLRLGFAAAFVLAMVIAVAAWRVALDFEREISAAYDTQLRSTVQLAEAQSALWEMRLGVRQLVDGDPDAQQRAIEQHDRLHGIIQERLAAYARTARSSDERTSLTVLRAAYQRYWQARARFVDLWQAGDRDAAIAWRALTVAPFGREAGEAFESQVALQRSFAEGAREASARKVQSSLAVAAAITVALLGMLVAGFVYTAWLLRPIRALRAEAQRVLREQLGETVDPSLGGRNEVASLMESFQLMADRLLARTESLRQARERLDFLLQATPAIIYSARPHGDQRLTYISPNVRTELGYDAEEFMRDAALWASRVHPDDRERVLARLRGLGAGHRVVDEYRFRHRDGSWRWLHDEAATSCDAAGGPLELVGYRIDVTQRRHAEAATAQALQVKTNLLNNVTHELRTPLNGILGFAELLKEEVAGPLNPRQAQFADDILASGARLFKLVDGLLEMSRLGAPAAGFAGEPVSVAPVLQECVAAHRHAAAARGVTIRVEVPRDAGETCIDPAVLRRILDALVDNAIKFNREGGAVALSARRNAHGLEVAVADTGVGMAREEAHSAFDPLVQLDGGLARRHGGIGIGLTLAHGLAEMIGGWLEVQSESGVGSTFTLHLPTWEAP